MFDFIKTCGRVPLAAAGLMLLLAGCGVSQYNALMSRRLASLRSGAKFKNFYAPSPLAGVPISIRIPLIFAKSYQQSSAHKDDGESINPDRLQPPFLKLPGFILCYEGTNTTGNRTLPFYCYLAALPAKPGDADQIANDLQAQLKKAFPDMQDEWQGADAETPEGRYIHWRRIRVGAEQPFQVKMDKVTTENLPGTFELWMHEAENYIVLIGWRAPDSVLGESTLAADNESALRLAIEGPPKDATLDIEELPAATAGTLAIDEASGQ